MLARTAAVALLVLLAGCAQHPGPAPAPSQTATASPTTAATSSSASTATVPIRWQTGDTIEMVGCTGMSFNLAADRTAVEAVVPKQYTIPGSGPVLVNVFVDRCDGLVLGNKTLLKQADLLYAWLDVNHTPQQGGPARQSYLLDLSSSWPTMNEAGQTSMVAGDAITFQRSTDSTGEMAQVHGTKTAYQFTSPPNPFPTATLDPYDTQFWGGPDEGFSIIFHDAVRQANSFQVPGTCQFQSGPLSAIFPTPTACLVGDETEAGTMTLEKRQGDANA